MIKQGLWERQIEDALSEARVAVLLVSPDFLASDFIAEKELPPLLEAAANEGLSILWVAVSSSAYKTTAIAKYQAANNPMEPLNGLPPADLETRLVQIAQKIDDTFNPHEDRKADGPFGLVNPAARVNVDAWAKLAAMPVHRKFADNLLKDEYQNTISFS